MAKTILPVFRDFPNEARIIGNLLAGYTNIEIGLMNCVQAAREDFDTVLKTMFRIRGETSRIDIADALGQNHYKKYNLDGEFIFVIGVVRHCLKIRNQYAHCAWWNDLSGKLAFANLEEIAKLDAIQTDLQHLTTYHADIPLLTEQEAYFSYADDLTTYINHEVRFRSGVFSSQPFPVPKQIEQPPLRIP